MQRRTLLASLIALLGVVVLSSFVTMQQGSFRETLRHNPEARANCITTIMKDKLSLNSAQFDKAYQINLKYSRLMQSYLKNTQRTPEMKNQMLALNQQRQKELRGVLTTEQLKRANEIRQQWINRLQTIVNRMKANQFSNQ